MIKSALEQGLLDITKRMLEFNNVICPNEMAFKLALHNNDRICDKIKTELCKVTEEELNNLINESIDLCILARQEGYFSLIEHVNIINNDFVEDLLYALSGKYNNGNNIGLWREFSYIFIPYLMSVRYIGTKFLESAIIFEGILLSLHSLLSPIQLKFALNNFVGRTIVADEMFSESPITTVHLDHSEWGMSMQEQNIFQNIDGILSDLNLTLKEDYYSFTCSIVNKKLIYDKFINELKNTNEKQCIDIIEKIYEVCISVEDIGIKEALKKYQSVTGSQFVQNLNYLLSTSTQKYDENVQITSYCFNNLLFSNDAGIKYVENILCYEGFIMLVNTLEMTSKIRLFKLSDIKYRLYGLVGIHHSLKDCKENKYQWNQVCH